MMETMAVFAALGVFLVARDKYRRSKEPKSLEPKSLGMSLDFPSLGGFLGYALVLVAATLSLGYCAAKGGF